jgi:hypothetical protein
LAALVFPLQPWLALIRKGELAALQDMAEEVLVE